MTNKHTPKTLKNDHLPPKAIKSMAKAMEFYEHSDHLLKNRNDMSDAEIMEAFNKIRLQFLELKEAGRQAWAYATEHGVGHELARYTAAAATQHKGVEDVYFKIERRMQKGKTLSQAMDDLTLDSFSPAKKEVWHGGDEHKFPNPLQSLNNFTRPSLGAKVDAYVSALRSNFEKIDAGMRKIAPMYAKADEELARMNAEREKKFQAELGPKQKQLLQVVAKQKRDALKPAGPDAPKPSLLDMMKQALKGKEAGQVAAQVTQEKPSQSKPAPITGEVDTPPNGAARNTMRAAYKVGLSL